MSDRFVFVGNRRFVLQAMLDEGLDMAAVFAIEGTHIVNDLTHGALAGTSHTLVSSKSQLLAELGQLEFDVLVSNGCPYILPVDELPPATYVNIHPSLLPDLRGIDPVIGSILHGRDAGATCHIMDAGIDTGDIISQVKIPYTEDLDVTTLYQLSFIAEAQSFIEAMHAGFKGERVQGEDGSEIYYNRSDEDWHISFSEDNDLLLRKVRAFNNRSIGCRFICEGREYRVFSAYRVGNPYLIEQVMGQEEGVVVLSFEGSILFHKDGDVLKFCEIDSEHGGSIMAGDRLFATV